MKSRILLSAIALFSISTAFAQDTSHYNTESKITFKDKPQGQLEKVTFKKKLNKKKKNNTVMYRDTRLGSSSPLYDTYKKNKNGAGAVTTTPKNINSGENPVIILKVDSTRH